MLDYLNHQLTHDSQVVDISDSQKHGVDHTLNLRIHA